MKSKKKKIGSKNRHMSVGCISSSKGLKLQREQPRRCQRETLAVPTGIMALRLTNKGRRLFRPGLKDCSMHTNRLPAPIQEPFPKDFQIHKGWHPTPTLHTTASVYRAGPSGKAASSSCVLRGVCVCVFVCTRLLTSPNKIKKTGYISLLREI